LQEHAEFPFTYLNAFPNRFLEKGMCAIASMKNKGLLHCELVLWRIEWNLGCPVAD